MSKRASVILVAGDAPGPKRAKKAYIPDPAEEEAKKAKAAAAAAAARQPKQPRVYPDPPPAPEGGRLRSTMEVYRKKAAAAAAAAALVPGADAVRKEKGRSVLTKMEEQLKGGKFRWLNEQMYTTSSGQSSELFAEDPALFADYHEGYREQVVKWPANPLDCLASMLAKKHTETGKKNAQKRVVCADLGCGDGFLARLLFGKMEVHSFDLVASASHVVSCDVALRIPLPSGSVDHVVCCLSLMGTNWPNTIREAARILAPGGHLHIAEVTSRLQHTLEDFMYFVDSCGFKTKVTPLGAKENTHFTLIQGVKTWDSRFPYHDRDPSGLLAPCLYKKR